MTTIHTRHLQQYTRPTNNNYKQDKLKLAKIRMTSNNTHYTALQTFVSFGPFSDRFPFPPTFRLLFPMTDHKYNYKNIFPFLK